MMTCDMFFGYICFLNVLYCLLVVILMIITIICCYLLMIDSNVVDTFRTHTHTIAERRWKDFSCASVEDINWFHFQSRNIYFHHFKIVLSALINNNPTWPNIITLLAMNDNDNKPYLSSRDKHHSFLSFFLLLSP